MRRLEPPRPAPRGRPYASAQEASAGRSRAKLTSPASATADRPGRPGLPGSPVGLTPAVAVEQVVVRLYRRGRKVAARAVTARRRGAYRTRMTSAPAAQRDRPGVASRDAALGTAVAVKPLRLDVLPRRVGARQRGGAVRMLQRHLASAATSSAERAPSTRAPRAPCSPSARSRACAARRPPTAAS
jgi:hypothetical protein